MSIYLLIDDDEMINFIHRQVILSVDPGADIRILSSAKEGLDKMKALIESDNGKETIVFVDINMPEMNGFELMSELNTIIRQPHRLHVYVVSSSLFESDRIKALAFPFVKGYKEKPLSKADINEVRKLLC